MKITNAATVFVVSDVNAFSLGPRMSRCILRRRIQFRLRTLLLVLAAVSIWLAAEVKAVRDRRTALDYVTVISAHLPDKSAVSWVRRRSATAHTTI